MVYRRFIKRFFDLFFCTLAIPVLGLLVILLSPVIFLTDNGPVFYNAPRLGKDGKIFRMYKFRTMYMDSPDIRKEDHSTYNAGDDPRVTPIGKFLRKTSLDETPQILNVLKGEMSMIGPRPDLPEHIQLYTETEKKKLRVLPGLTGYSQAYFRNSAPWKIRLQNDVYYEEHMSFSLDVKILFKTFSTVILRKGVYADQEELLK